MRTVYLRGLLWLYLLVGFMYLATAIESGFLDFDNLPDTNFSCVGKVIGGYYADLETNCQMFHVCTIGQLDEPMDIRFLCLNGTVFDQETRVCERIDEVDCSKSEQFYSLNLELYGNNQPSVHEDTEPPIIIKASTTTSTTTTTVRPRPTTTLPRATTVTKIISHHFPISSGGPDIRFNPEEINISLNPNGGVSSKTVAYQKQVFNDNDNNKVVVTTHTSFGTTQEDVLKVVPNTQKPTEINYGFTNNYQYHSVPYGQYRNQFKTTTRKSIYRTEKPQRLQLPLPFLSTLPPLTFSSPAPFSLDRHIEAKRYANPTPPRIIISASASVSDNSGRRLNYSLGTIGVTPLLELPPKSYDDYKDQDVVLDPFYDDVPKIRKARKKRQTDESAIDVLKFLFEWYDNHQKTSTIKVPIDAQDITEINQQLAPVLTSDGIKISGDILSVTEDATSTTEFTTTKTVFDASDYVDDNYEAQKFEDVSTSTTVVTEDLKILDSLESQKTKRQKYIENDRHGFVREDDYKSKSLENKGTDSTPEGKEFIDNLKSKYPNNSKEINFENKKEIDGDNTRVEIFENKTTSTTVVPEQKVISSDSLKPKIRSRTRQKYIHNVKENDNPSRYSQNYTRGSDEPKNRRRGRQRYKERQREKIASSEEEAQDRNTYEQKLKLRRGQRYRQKEKENRSVLVKEHEQKIEIVEHETQKLPEIITTTEIDLPSPQTLDEEPTTLTITQDILEETTLTTTSVVPEETTTEFSPINEELEDSNEIFDEFFYKTTTEFVTELPKLDDNLGTITSTSTSTTTVVDDDITTEIIPKTNLTPVETTTKEIEQRTRTRGRTNKSYHFKPNPRHRFLTNQITTPISTSTITDVEEVPPTDASLSKSANPTQAESVPESSLPTTPMYKINIRKTFIFNCFGKAINKFYSDPRDCRLFHYCTNGYTKNQLLDLKFVCDLGTFFDDEKLICTKTVPQRCV